MILKCPSCDTNDRIAGGDLQFEGEKPYCYKQTCECACGARFALRFDLSRTDWLNRDDMGAAAHGDPAITDQVARKKAEDRERMKQSLERAIRVEFPTDTVDISDGYCDNVHILVTSRRFDDMSQRNKLEMLWTLVDSCLNEEERELVSLITAWSVSELLDMFSHRCMEYPAAICRRRK